MAMPVRYRTDERELPDDLVTILGCKRCLIMGADVKGIKLIWSELGPGVADQVMRAAWDGVQQWHF
jgi:hypothetical protein